MAIPHASSAQVLDVRPLGAQLSGAETTTLFKTYAVEVIRMILPAGKEIPPHSLPGEVILQCIEGRVEVRTGDRSSTLAAGHLLYLDGHQTYGLRAAANSSLLVTILLQHKAAEAAA
jgi:quercetin dioxygenase-like cupin family protein